MFHSIYWEHPGLCSLIDIPQLLSLHLATHFPHCWAHVLLYVPCNFWSNTLSTITTTTFWTLKKKYLQYWDHFVKHAYLHFPLHQCAHYWSWTLNKALHNSCIIILGYTYSNYWSCTLEFMSYHYWAHALLHSYHTYLCSVQEYSYPDY